MMCNEWRLIRFSVAAVWLATGFIVLAAYPEQDSMGLLARAGFTGLPAVGALYGGAVLMVFKPSF